MISHLEYNECLTLQFVGWASELVLPVCGEDSGCEHTWQSSLFMAHSSHMIQCYHLTLYIVTSFMGYLCSTPIYCLWQLTVLYPTLHDALCIEKIVHGIKYAVRGTLWNTPTTAVPRTEFTSEYCTGAYYSLGNINVQGYKSMCICLKGVVTPYPAFGSSEPFYRRHPT